MTAMKSIRTALSALTLVLLASSGFAQGSEEVVYFHADAVGSVRLVTDANGQVVERYDYLPFGEPYPPSAPVVETRRFGGKERDAETGLDYFGGRYYASGNGRFTTVDPLLDVDNALVNPQLWNRYTYGLNNPLKFTDPDGRNPVLVTGGIGAAVYAAWNAYVNVQQGRPWYENIGVDASKGFLVGATLGLVAPALSAVSVADATAATTTAALAGRALANAREARVADLIGGRIAGDLPIFLPGVGRSAVDVIGRSGELIGVGGPAKARDLADLGVKLKILAGVAEKAGVKAQYYFQKGTPMEAIRLAQKWLGKENVFEFEIVP